MGSVAIHPPELAERVDAGLPPIGSRSDEGTTDEVDASLAIPQVGRVVANGTIFALLGVQLAWIAFLAVVVISIVR